MNERKRPVAAIAIAMLCAAVLTPIASPAAGAATCQIVATVRLNAWENITRVNGGDGALSASFVCEGSIAGTALTSPGTFTFCTHTTGAHCGTSQPDMEPFADALAPATIVSHIQGHVEFRLDVTGLCGLDLNGHSYATHADIQFSNFKCPPTSGSVFGGASGAEIARAEAEAEILFDAVATTENRCQADSNNFRLCFRELSFLADVVAVDQ